MGAGHLRWWLSGSLESRRLEFSRKNRRRQLEYATPPTLPDPIEMFTLPRWDTTQHLQRVGAADLKFEDTAFSHAGLLQKRRGQTFCNQFVQEARMMEKFEEYEKPSKEEKAEVVRLYMLIIEERVKSGTHVHDAIIEADEWLANHIEKFVETDAPLPIVDPATARASIAAHLEEHAQLAASLPVPCGYGTMQGTCVLVSGHVGDHQFKAGSSLALLGARDLDDHERHKQAHALLAAPFIGADDFDKVLKTGEMPEGCTMGMMGMFKRGMSPEEFEKLEGHPPKAIGEDVTCHCCRKKAARIIDTSPSHCGIGLVPNIDGWLRYVYPWANVASSEAYRLTDLCGECAAKLLGLLEHERKEKSGEHTTLDEELLCPDA